MTRTRRRSRPRARTARRPCSSRGGRGSMTLPRLRPRPHAPEPDRRAAGVRDPRRPRHAEPGTRVVPPGYGRPHGRLRHGWHRQERRAADARHRCGPLHPSGAVPRLRHRLRYPRPPDARAARPRRAPSSTRATRSGSSASSPVCETRSTIGPGATRRSTRARITEYRELASKPDEPRILLLIDGIGTFREAYEVGPQYRLWETFQGIVADGRQVGVHVVVTADRASGDLRRPWRRSSSSA